jgi:hypothetical protein
LEDGVIDEVCLLGHISASQAGVQSGPLSGVRGLFSFSKEKNVFQKRVFLGTVGLGGEKAVVLRSF